MRLRIVLTVLVATGGVALPSQDKKELLAEYKRRYKAIDQKDGGALAKLAVWCRDNKLKPYDMMLFKKALKVDPNNDAANLAMGNEKLDGKWYAPEEANQIRAAARAAARAAEEAKAVAKKRGRLLVPDEPAKRAEVIGQIAAKAGEANKRRDKYAQVIGADKSKYAAAFSDHVQIVAKNIPERAPYFVEIGEWVYRKLSWATFGKHDAKSFEKFGGFMKFYLTDSAALIETMDFLRKHDNYSTLWNDLDKYVETMRRYELEFSTLHDPPIHIHINPDNQASAVANVMAVTFLQWHAKPWYAEHNIKLNKPKEFTMMGWMLEGLGVWASLHAVGTNRLYRIKKPRYANKSLVEKDVDLNYAEVAFDAVTKGKSGDQNARSFFQLCYARVNTWNIVDIAMSFALVDYMLRNRLDDWRGLVAKLGKTLSFRAAFIQQFGNDDERRQALMAVQQTHEDAVLQRLFRPIAEHFEKDFKAWVEKEYETLRDEPEKWKDNAPFAKAPKKKG